jgi:rubrerythrin
MTRDELIARLKQLHDEEELAIPIYTRHLESTFFLSSFKPETQEAIKKTLLTLSLESKAHARMFKTMIKKVQESERDVY